MCNGGISWNIRQIHALQIIPVKILSPFYPASLRFREAEVPLPSPARSVSLLEIWSGVLPLEKRPMPLWKRISFNVRKKADDITARLLDLVEKDAEAFEPLSAAYGMPKSTPEEIEKKAEVMEAALVGACEVPLEIMRTCAEAIDLIETFAEKGSKIAISDAGVGATLLKSALQGAFLNIYINTKSMADKEAAASYNKEADMLREKYEKKADEIFQSVCNKIR